MNEQNKPAASRDANVPSAALERLGEALLGTWRLTGGAEGESDASGLKVGSS